MQKAVVDSFTKLNPRHQLKNPVMFVTLVGAVLTFQQLFTSKEPFSYVLQIALWLLFTVVFANFAEAVAEGRGKAQARALRASRKQLVAKRQAQGRHHRDRRRLACCAGGTWSSVVAGELIPGDGEVVEGAASVDESAITGESAPVIREAGGDRSAVTGGTGVLSDHLLIRITANPGEGFLDHMISLVEGATRQKTPNEIALTILLSALTFIFLLVIIALKPFGIYSNVAFTITALIALLVCLIPTTIGGLLARHRHRRHGPPAPAKRPRDERAGGRGRRGHRRPPSRQDGHDHARQPHGRPSSRRRPALPPSISPTRPSSRP